MLVYEGVKSSFINDVDLNLITVNEDNYRELTRTIAKHYEVSVYKIRDLYDDFLKHLSHVTVHFKFLGSNRVLLNIYSFEDDLISMVNFEYTDTGESPEINFKPLSSDDFGVGESFGSDDYMENLYFNISCLWATGMWYLATTTNTKKYYSETKSDIVTSRHKNVVNVSSTKSIITPIYDLTKIKYVKTEKLIARRQGWTYSHSFQVHGHYRHYKDGRVIFIKPFIKGKGKEFMSQTINLVPNA